MVYVYGQQEHVQGRGAPEKSSMGRLSVLSESRTIHGNLAVYAVMIGYSTAFMTFGKTVLYWLVEACSGEPLSKHAVAFEFTDPGL